MTGCTWSGKLHLRLCDEYRACERHCELKHCTKLELKKLLDLERRENLKLLQIVKESPAPKTRIDQWK